MLPNKSLKASADDLVTTIKTAVQQNELSKEDRDWLVTELDELIDNLKKAKTKLAKENKKAA